MTNLSGILGIFSKDFEKNISTQLYMGLYGLQHRGQASMGLSTMDKEKIYQMKGRGLISEQIANGKINKLKGYCGLGHVKYAFSKEAKNHAPMPWSYHVDDKIAMIAIDGNILNEDFTVKELIEKIDGGMEDLQEYIGNLRGAFTILYLDQEKMVGIRDPFGIKSLAYDKSGNFHYFSSESCAIHIMGSGNTSFLEPGEIRVVDKDGAKSYPSKDYGRNLCLFELVYIARADSVIDGIEVYDARYEMGRMLSQEYPVDADIVVGAPDSGMIAALGYAVGSGIPYQKGIIKNNYIPRTFILPDEKMRQKMIQLKLSVIESNIKNREIILVDDSIVRGTTIRKTIEILKNAGAKKVHVRIASPPVVEEENLSIDIPEKSQLIAYGHSKEEVGQMIGSDSLEYLSLAGLRKACGGGDFYEKYFGGNYPLEEQRRLG